jgi:hypothetical protein
VAPVKKVGKLRLPVEHYLSFANAIHPKSAQGLESIWDSDVIEQIVMHNPDRQSLSKVIRRDLATTREGLRISRQDCLGPRETTDQNFDYPRDIL